MVPGVGHQLEHLMPLLLVPLRFRAHYSFHTHFHPTLQHGVAVVVQVEVNCIFPLALGSQWPACSCPYDLPRWRRRGAG